MDPRVALKKTSDVLSQVPPRRNCDVYKTPDEMHNAFLEVCEKYKYCDNSRDNPCPYYHPILACEFVWAGAEYKEDDNGRSNDR